MQAAPKKRDTRRIYTASYWSITVSVLGGVASVLVAHLVTQLDQFYARRWCFEKEQIAKVLAEAHRNLEPTIERIMRIVGPNEADRGEPIKLLEVNATTVASGIWPIAFSPAPPDVPYGSVVVEVTPDEYAAIRARTLPLPSGWSLGDELYAVSP